MQAIVLSRRDFREYDQIISLYTRERGKVELLARGVKKIASKNSSFLEPCSYIIAEHVVGREIDRLTTAQPLALFHGIWQHHEKLFAARLVASLVERMTEAGERDGRLFFLLLEWMRYADRTAAWQPIVVDSFLVLFLSHLGLAPRVDACVVCGKSFRVLIQEELACVPAEARRTKTGFYFAGGGLVCAACRSAKQALGEEIYDCGLKEASNLSTLLKGNFSLIDRYPIGIDELRCLHRLVYAFSTYHMEYRLADWWGIWHHGVAMKQAVVNNNNNPF